MSNDLVVAVYEKLKLLSRTYVAVPEDAVQTRHMRIAYHVAARMLQDALEEEGIIEPDGPRSPNIDHLLESEFRKAAPQLNDEAVRRMFDLADQLGSEMRAKRELEEWEASGTLLIMM